MENKPTLMCPNCAEELISDSLSEIFGYCCLNDECEIGITKPETRWFLNDVLHREDGPALEYTDGEKWWYLNGELHRENGPAVERPNGTKEWYLNGKRHREDGPAVEFASGKKEWWANGKQYKYRIYKKKIK